MRMRREESARPIDAGDPRIAFDKKSGKSRPNMRAAKEHSPTPSLMSLNPRETIMRCEMALSMLLSLSIFGLASMTFATDAPVACSGHKLLPIPRPESSCSDVKPQIYPSPDGALRALVFPVDVSLYATPDMESRVVIRSSNSDTLISKDYSSPRGANGYYLVNANGRPTRNSSSTACRRPAATRPGHFR